jgi:hypothetical protein
MQTFTAKQYLQIDIANNFGNDKEDWDVRLAWFEENERRLESLIKEAAEPAMYEAGVRAYRSAMKGNVNHYPISLDATSSGIQILSCLTGDRKGAELCNVVDVGRRMDAYTTMYQQMAEKIGESTKIDRKDVKKAVMTSFYGSEAVPKRVFGEGALLATFEETMEEGAPGAWELNKAMLDIWDPNATKYSWVMPDNFHVHIKVMTSETGIVHFLNKPYEITYTINASLEKGRSLGANSTHSIDGMVVREMGLRCNYDPEQISKINALLDPKLRFLPMAPTSKEDELVKILWDHYLDSGFLSARILSYLSHTNIGLVDRTIIFDLVMSLPKKPFQIISVHDCFRCLPNYGNDLRRQYNLLLAHIAKSNLLSFLLSQITGRLLTIGKLDPDLWKDVIHANYALS